MPAEEPDFETWWAECGNGCPETKKIAEDAWETAWEVSKGVEL